jgi:DNA anti-recombination protein RmuC
MKGVWIMSDEVDTTQGLSLDRKTMDILVANIIPTTKYFESRFDHLQYQVSELKAGQKNLLEVMDKRFTAMQSGMDERFTAMQSGMDKRFTAMQSDMDKRFTAMQSDMDKRFEQVDKRFEQVDGRFVSLKADMDKRFQQVDDKLDKILDRIDRRIDEGLRENRVLSMRMFTFAMTFSAISMIGLVGKMMKLF